MRHAVTVPELERWRENGAGWRLVELTERRVEVELSTCYGEPVDRLESEDPTVIAFLRDQPAEPA